MKIEQIVSEWKKDSKIDNTDLANEALKLPGLHAKYLEIYTNENMILKKMFYDYKSFEKIKTMYYQGILPEEDRIELGWEVNNNKILKDDMKMYLAADKDMQSALLKIDLQKQKVENLESIIESINRMGFAIKNAIDFIKFCGGN